MKTNNKFNSAVVNSKLLNNWDLLYSSIKKNFMLVACIIVQIVCFSILYPSNPSIGSIGNIFYGFITFNVSIVSGYYVHVYSHLYDYQELYNSFYKSSNIIGYLLQKMPTPIKWVINKIVFFLDFHDKIHHNTAINKQWHNILIETLMNMYTEGLGLILFFKLFDFAIHFGGYVFRFNYPILFAWCLLYSSIHNINYNIIRPICHIQHHINEKTNYGIDFMDIIIGSKFDNIPEEMNHASLNVILIMLLIIFLKDFCNYNSNSDNTFMKYFYYFVFWFISY